MGRPRKIKLETVEREGLLEQVVPVGQRDVEEAAAEMSSEGDGLNSDER